MAQSKTTKDGELGTIMNYGDRLLGLAVRVPRYRSRGSGFDSRRYKIF
jgi:hypothetical protein